MTPSQSGDVPATDGFDDELSRGLQVAFGGSAPGDAAGRSILAALGETLGIHPRVLLRDAADESSPVAVRGREDEEGIGASLGRYQLAGEVARGGVGIILKGRDPDLGRDVAIKVLRGEHMSRPGMAARFIEEAQIAAQLQHPGILPVYELGIADAQRPYFSMKLIKGRTLAALLAERTNPAQDRQRYVGIFEQVCQAVAYAHARGVVHRDLKPANVMVGTFGEVQVVDWGLAKVLQSGGLADERESASVVSTVRSDDAAAQSLVGSVVGTPAYMSPEQAKGEVHHLDERSDVFSLGAILCEILCGSPPYCGGRHDVLAQAREGNQAATHAKLAACDADAALVDLAKECLSPAPGKRPRNAAAIAERVARHIASIAERVRASELAAARADARANSERRARRFTAGLSLVAIVATFGFFGAIAYSQQERRSQQAERAALVNEAVDTAAEQLGRAIAAPIGEKEPWFAVRAGAVQIEDRMRGGPVDGSTLQRVESFFTKLSKAERDRRLVENVEEAVIRGATHNDAKSWTWMERALRDAFLAYEIDLTKLTPDETAERIRHSDLATQLADALELWMATRAQLSQFGIEGHAMNELLPWLSAIYAADTDPFTTSVRKLVYAPTVNADDVMQLLNSVELSDVRPRTLAWLGAAAYRAGKGEIVEEIFRRALLVYPNDLMLNFDYAYQMTYAGKHEKAIRAYNRCLALRPNAGGIWRSLGVSLRTVGDLQGAVDAFQQSITHQPEHSPTYVDLATTLETLGKRDEAAAMFRQALEYDPASEDAAEGLRRLESTPNAEPDR